MSPRRYSMTRKKAVTAEFRQRILDATLKLHGQKGIFGTSWKDIAHEADVSVGTVYKHFPTLDELVPACGELLMERLKPPNPESIGEILGNATTPIERLLNVAKALFAFYHRGGRHLESDLRERELPAMREWEDYLRAMVTGFIREALIDNPFHGSPGRTAGASLFPQYPLQVVRVQRVRATTRRTSAHSRA